MRKISLIITATLVIMLSAAAFAPPANALAGHIAFGGYDRGGYEFSR
jgi:hypothetical protein